MKKKVPCAVMSRVVGFYSVVKIGDYDHWHPGKIAEWNDRVPFDKDKMLSHPFVRDVEPVPVATPVESTPVVPVEAT